MLIENYFVPLCDELALMAYKIATMIKEKDLDALINKVDEVVDKQFDFIKEMKGIKQAIWQMKAETNILVEEKSPITKVAAVGEEKAPIAEEVVAAVGEEETPIVEEVVAAVREEEKSLITEVVAVGEEEKSPIAEEVVAAVGEEKTPIVEEVVAAVGEEEMSPIIEEEAASVGEEEKAPIIEEAVAVGEEEKTPIEAAAAVGEEKSSIAEATAAMGGRVFDWEKKATKERVFSTDTPKNWDWERFIGENLLSKIGIAIVLIGVFIGVKYSIDHNLISPEMRLALGYAMGVGLFVTGAFLKKNYKNFSAILVSGAMAIFYFVTFIAYSVFEFFPQGFTFVLMFLFTAFTVLASLSYNQVAIALIGLVGSYAIPFLLSNNSGRVDILFAYTAIINIGVLILSFYKQWMQLFVSAFFFTWILLLVMFADSSYTYRQEHFTAYMSFNVVTFLTFYGSFIAQKIKQVKTLSSTDVAVFLLNSLLFYGIGGALIESVYDSNSALAVFTLANALFHLGVAYYFHRCKEDYNVLKYLILVLALSFATLVIPIQFKGSWVTLFWSAEAALLFIFGRLKGLPVFERISYAVTFLATGNMLIDWAEHSYSIYDLDLLAFHITPFANALFINALLYCLAMGAMLYVHQKREGGGSYAQAITFFLNVFFVGGLFYTFLREIGVALDMQFLREPNFTDTYRLVQIQDLSLFKKVAYISYSLVFVAGYSMLNMRFFKNKPIGEIQMVLSYILSGVFILFGLYYFSELRGRYIDAAAEGEVRSLWFLSVRYVGIMAFGLLCYSAYRLQLFLNTWTRNQRYLELLLHLSVLWVGSSELLHWTELYESTSNYKLGLTILWGAYAILLIVMGLLQKKKYLRLSGITLISFSILKLFVYDTTHLDTLRKTIVFVVLGLLILIASFLYNKFTKNEEVKKEEVGNNEPS